MTGADGVTEVRLWLYPLFEEATWKLVEVDERGTRTRDVRLWGWTDENRLGAEIVSRTRDSTDTHMW